MIEPGPRTAERRNPFLGVVVGVAIACIVWTALALAYLIATGRA